MLTSRELATVLASLRYWQRELAKDGPPIPDAQEFFKDELPLTEKEIDVLCERINVKDPRPKIVDAMGKALQWLTNLEDYSGKQLLLTTMPNNFGRQVLRDLISELGGPAQEQLTWKQFKVVSVSSNLNSFGLHGMVLMAKDGEAWQAGANSVNIRKKGETITVPVDRDTQRLMFERCGFEIPERMKPDAPPSVAAEVWKEEAPCPKKKSSSSSSPTAPAPSKSSPRPARARKSRVPSKKAQR